MVHPGYFFPPVIDTSGDTRAHNSIKHLILLSGKILTRHEHNDCLLQPVAVELIQSPYPFPCGMKCWSTVVICSVGKAPHSSNSFSDRQGVIKGQSISSSIQDFEFLGTQESIYIQQNNKFMFFFPDTFDIFGLYIGRKIGRGLNFIR